MNGLPTVRIDDLIVHPRDSDLIVGTHGRSIWIIDDITALEQMTDTTHDDRRARCSTSGRRRRGSNDIQKAITVGGAKHFRGAEPGARHGDQLLAEERAGGRRAHHDHRRDRPRDPHRSTARRRRA